MDYPTEILNWLEESEKRRDELRRHDLRTRLRYAVTPLEARREVVRELHDLLIFDDVVTKENQPMSERDGIAPSEEERRFQRLQRARAQFPKTVIVHFEPIDDGDRVMIVSENRIEAAPEVGDHRVVALYTLSHLEELASTVTIL